MTRPMRVAMLSQGYLPLVGGAEQQLAALAPRLQELNVDVHIITRRHAGLDAFEMMAGVPIHRMPIPGPKPTRSLAFTLAALARLRALKPDLIHAHELFSPATTALAAKRVFRLPVVATPHRSGPIGDVQRLHEKALGARRMAAFLRQIDAFQVISRDIDAELDSVGVPAERRVFIPNGVDTARFAPICPAERQRLRAVLGLPDGPIVVFSGRLAPEKRVGNLLTVWPTVRASVPDAHLLLLGAGPEEVALKRLASDGVDFRGSVENVAPFLQSSDAFVLPSSAEGLSVALLEALSSGLPAVATAVGGAPDVIAEGRTGLLVPPDNLDALCAALVCALTDASWRTRAGQDARQTIERDYSVHGAAGRLRGLYDELIDATPTQHQARRS